MSSIFVGYHMPWYNKVYLIIYSILYIIYDIHNTIMIYVVYMSLCELGLCKKQRIKWSLDVDIFLVCSTSGQEYYDSKYLLNDIDELTVIHLLIVDGIINLDYRWNAQYAVVCSREIIVGSREHALGSIYNEIYS